MAAVCLQDPPLSVDCVQDESADLERWNCLWCWWERKSDERAPAQAKVDVVD